MEGKKEENDGDGKGVFLLCDAGGVGEGGVGGVEMQLPILEFGFWCYWNGLVSG